MRVTEVPRSPAQPSRLVVWLIQGTPHTAVRLWQLCHLVGDLSSGSVAHHASAQLLEKPSTLLKPLFGHEAFADCTTELS